MQVASLKLVLIKMFKSEFLDEIYFQNSMTRMFSYSTNLQYS